MIYNYVKPNVIVDINELQQKMEKITILTADLKSFSKRSTRRKAMNS